MRQFDKPRTQVGVTCHHYGARCKCGWEGECQDTMEQARESLRKHQGSGTCKAVSR